MKLGHGDALRGIPHWHVRRRSNLVQLIHTRRRHGEVRGNTLRSIYRANAKGNNVDVF